MIFMKNLKKIFILLMVTVLISGCTVKTEYNMAINSDKSMDYSVILAFDEEFLNAMSENTAEDEEELAIEKTNAYIEAIQNAYTANQTGTNPVQIPATGLTGNITDNNIIGEITVEEPSATAGTFTILPDGTITITGLVYNGYTCNNESGEVVCEIASEDTFENNATDLTDETAEVQDSTSLNEEEKWALIDETISKQDRQAYEKKGYKVERYSKDDYKGYRFTKSFKNIEDIRLEDINFNVETDINEAVAETEGTIANTKESSLDLKASIFTKDGLNYKASIPRETTGDSSSLNSYFDMQLVVTLPNEVINHNADKVSNDGKTLSWNLVSNDGNMEFEFSLISKYVIYAVIGAIVLLLLIIIILIIKKISKNHKKKKELLQTKVDNSPSDNIQPMATTTPVPNEPVMPKPLETAMPVAENLNTDSIVPVNENTLEVTEKPVIENPVTENPATMNNATINTTEENLPNNIKSSENLNMVSDDTERL